MTIKKQQLDTPCLAIDIDLLEKNIQWMQQEASEKNKQLRPHAKTHKCSNICKQQINAGAIGICTTKISEAQVLVDVGIQNILVTSPVVTPQKIDKLQYCLKRDPNFAVVIDSIDNANALDKAAQSCQQTTLKVLY